MTISGHNRIALWSRWALVSLCVLGLIVAQAAGALAARTNVAGLIVDYGDGRVSYAWVPFSEDEISAVELLERSGLDVVAVSFGGMGEAICQIDDTGCPVGDCRTRMCQTSDPDSPFWRYTRQTDDGTWRFAATGASGVKVRDGDVDAWVWSGKDVDLPAITIDEIAKRARADMASLDDTASVPPAKVVTEGHFELGNDDHELRDQIGPTLVILAVAGFAIFLGAAATGGPAMSGDRLDSRAWLAWGASAIVPLLIARNPWVVAVILGSVLAVRRAWAPYHRPGWGWIVRLAMVFMAVGILFNALTVHSGNQVLFTIPDAIPLIGGRITLNAVAYGIVSAVAIVTLVLTGTTVAAGLVWVDLMRSMPPRIAPLAVAGSVAWSFLPGASRTFHEIRESQAVRGHRLRGTRDLPPLIVPLLGGALDQAITMSEALESRGFGAAGEARKTSAASRVALVIAIAAFLLVAYAGAVGQERVALAAALVGVAGGIVALRGSRGGRRTTRYRPSQWRETDTLVAVASLCAVLLFLWRYRVYPEAVIFNPYPNLNWPAFDLVMLASLALLAVPALLAPSSPEARR